MSMHNRPLKILHIVEHGIVLNSGYGFRSVNIFRAQRERGWQPIIGAAEFLRLRHPGSLSPAPGQAASTTRAEGRRVGRTMGGRAIGRWPALRICTICPIDIEGLYGSQNIYSVAQAEVWDVDDLADAKRCPFDAVVSPHLHV